MILIKPEIFEDESDFFSESSNQAQFEAAIGRPVKFVQDNYSLSINKVLHSLYCQIQEPQVKLVRMLQVTISLRENSKTFSQWVGEILSAENKRQLWPPVGLAHGFIVLSETAEFLYKTTDYYAPANEGCILWNEITIHIKWPKGIQLLSAKDAQGKAFIECEVFT